MAEYFGVQEAGLFDLGVIFSQASGDDDEADVAVLFDTLGDECVYDIYCSSGITVASLDLGYFQLGPKTLAGSLENVDYLVRVGGFEVYEAHSDGVFARVDRL